MDDTAEKAKRIPPLFPIPEIVKNRLVIDMAEEKLWVRQQSGELFLVPTRVTRKSGHQSFSITDFPPDCRWQHPDDKAVITELSVQY